MFLAAFLLVLLAVTVWIGIGVIDWRRVDRSYDERWLG